MQRGVRCKRALNLPNEVLAANGQSSVRRRPLRTQIEVICLYGSRKLPLCLPPRPIGRRLLRTISMLYAREYIALRSQMDLLSSCA